MDKRSAIPVQQDAPSTSGEFEQELSIYVVFTTISGTLAAIRRATEWASGLGARMRVLMPQVVPYALPLNRPAVDPLFNARKLLGACSQAQIETCIEVHLCRDAGECIKKSLRPESVVVLGGRKSWFQGEARLARKLRHLRHQVVFVPQR